MSAGRFLSLAPLQIAQALVGFGAIAAFTRLMSAEEFGRYALALSLSMAAHTIVFTWAEAAAFRFFTAARAERRLADHFATLTALALGLGLATLILTAGILLFAGLREDIVAITGFATGAAVLRFITRVARESDRAALNFTRFAVLETAYLALGFAAGVAFLVVFDLGAAAPFAGLMLGGAIVAVFDAPRLVTKAEGGKPTFKRSASYAAYGAPLALALAVELGVQALARIILAEQAGTASIGAFAAAFGLARPLDIIFMGVSAAFAPLVFAAFEDHGPDAARETARNAFATLAAVAVPACAGLALVAEPLATLMIGHALRDEAARALPWLALAGLCSGFTLYYWSEAFQLTRRTGLRAVLMLAPGVVQLTLTVLLARPFGAVGAAIAATAGAMVGAALLAVAGRRLLALPIPIGQLARVCGATALMGAGLMALPSAVTTLGLFTNVAVSGFIYAIAAIALDVLGARGRASAVLQTFSRMLRGFIHSSFMDRLNARARRTW